MNPILNNNLYFIKERTGIFKASNSYDIFNPENKQQILTSTEPNLGIITKIFRFTKFKSKTPFDVSIQTMGDQKVLGLQRGIAIFRSDVKLLNGNDHQIGVFKQKFWSMGGKFEIYDMQGKQVCLLQGKWTGWDFKFIRDGKELGFVSKKWAGLGKELFTTADNYMLQINDSVAPDDTIREFLVAAVICIDMVLKEK